MDSVKEVQDSIETAGFKLLSAQNQKDVYWDTEGCDLINLKRGLRVRYLEGEFSSVEFKSLFKKDDGSFFIEEVNLLKDKCLDLDLLKSILVERLGVLTDEFSKITGTSTTEILSSLGLKPTIILDKKRLIFTDRTQSHHICIDTIEGLPDHLEIESVKGNNLKDIAAMFESSLKLKKTQKSYIDLLLQKNDKILSSVEFEKRFKENRKWNIQPGENNIVDI